MIKREWVVRGQLILFALGLGMVLSAAVHASPPASNNGTSVLSYAGVLTKGGLPLAGTQSLVFDFQKGNVSACRSSAITVTPDSGGRFQALIPIGDCPKSLFDGGSVTVNIAANGESIAAGATISSVPYAVHAEQLGTSDCPSGYDRDFALASNPNAVACVQGSDHLVRVGRGATAFWIDRYEASIWNDSSATGTQYGAGIPYPKEFPPSAQGGPSDQLYAVSRSGVLPSVGMTWFQASRACRASGKRLPSAEEWTEAAWGTETGTDSNTGTCQTLYGSGVRRLTGQGGACASNWGAEDMVGNAAEVVSDYVIDASTATGAVEPTKWPAGFGGEMWRIASTSSSSSGAIGPLMMSRGGAVWDGAGASVFAMAATQTVSELADGFRCMVPR